MGGDHDDPVLRDGLASGKRGDDIDDPDGLLDPGRRRLKKGVLFDDEPPSGVPANAVELFPNPAARRSNAANRILLGAEGVPCSKPDQLAHRRLDPLGGDFADDLQNLGMLSIGDLGLLRL